MKARFLALVALVLGLASCQKDTEGFDVAVNGEVSTTVTVNLADASGTRAVVTNSANSAIANGVVEDTNYTLRYILQVFDKGNANVAKAMDFKYSDNTSVTFDVRLVPGRPYRFVVWADIVNAANVVDGEKCEDNHYAIGADLRYISLNDTEENPWVAMDETRDAYTGYADVDNYTSTSPIDLTLTRPFAKLRVVTTDIDELFGVNTLPTTATVEYTTTHYNAFNALEGKVIGDSKNRNIKHENYTIKSYGDNVANESMVLFTDYFFAIDNQQEAISFSLAVKDAKGEPMRTTHFNTNIPVQRNYLTTITGNVLTDGNNITVTVVDSFAQPGVEVEYVDTAADLQEAINDAATNGEETTIVLGGDIDLNDLFAASTSSTRASEPSYGLLIPAGKKVVLDLKGYTISQSKAQTGAYSMIDNQGTLTIEDSSANKSGKIVYGDNGNGGNYASNTIWNRGVLTINGGTIENNSSATVASNGFPHPIDNYGVLTINGGIFTNSANYSSMRIWCTTDDDTIITINGGTFNGSIDFQTPNASANKGTLTINGGTFTADTYTKCSVRLLGFGADVDEMNGYIKGGHFNGAIALKNWSGSELNSKVFDITGGTFTVDPSEFVDDDYNVVENNGVYSIERKPDVAKIGEVGYTSLAKAVAAVEDGGTITLVANEVFTERNRYNNGGWWDGLGYSGDKSFTIDLDGFTIGQENGALNDYLIWIKNDGSKANTITLKNGTLDAGTTAYCAFATASSNKQKITINLENVNLVGNNSNGAVAKIRGGSELNVKAGTVINGLNNYVGIECVNSTTNIYEGAKIYQKGTSSSWGCLVGVSGNGVVNVYGGNGTSARGGFIAMTSGGTINVAGGEWIANTDGTYANDNKGVLIAQSDKKYNAGAGNSVINVTGGTFKGGYNCYGNAVGDAQINIKGGNFNADPSSYLAEGCEATEANGVWTVRVLPVAKIGDVEYETLEAAVAAAKSGDTITLNRDITISSVTLPADIIFNGNDKQINGTINAGGNLTFTGHTRVTAFSASYYDRVITIGEGACLEVTGTGRVTLGYGNTFNITGSIENAKNADKTNIQPSLIIPGGISITGGNDAVLNVTNAYVKIGSTTSKPGAANGEFALNFTNAIVEFTKEFGFYDPTGGVKPAFKMNIKDSVFTTGTKIFLTKNSVVNVNNSVVALGTYLANRGELNLTNGSVMTGKTIQYGENGGNSGAITVDNSSFTIIGGSTGQAFDGKGEGSINAINVATVSVDYYKAMTINVDKTSTFTGTEVK